jgi:ribosomal protein S18 acetylase RimI-like enzyme
MMVDMIDYQLSPVISSEALNELFATAWDGHETKEFAAELERSLFYICAYSGSRLVGFVKVISDAGVHAFLLDTTVHNDFQHQGIGRELVIRAIAESRARSCDWLHVDFEEHLENFYQSCGFKPTLAGLVKLS